MPAVDIDFERSLLDGVGRLLLTEGDLDSARAVIPSIVRRREEVVPIVAKHKVVTIADANLRLLVASGGPASAEAAVLLDLVSPAAEQAFAHRDLIQKEASELAGLLSRLEERVSDFVIVKGLSNARFYPNPYTRWMRDLDILVSNWDVATVVLDALLNIGFDFDANEHAWIKADLSHGRAEYGQIFLIRRVEKDFSRIDLHFGTYSAGFSGYIRSMLMDRCEHISLAGADIPVLRAEHAVLVMQAHALSDGYVSVKDINDFVAIALTRDVDWEEVVTALNDHQLAPQTRLLAERALSLYDHPRVQEAATALLNGLAGGVRSWRLHDRDWSSRARVNADFAYRWHRSIGDGIFKSAVRCAQCYAAYIRHLRLAIRKRTLRERVLRRFMPAPDLRHWQLRPEACNLLVDGSSVTTPGCQPVLPAIPLHARHSKDIEWLSTESGELLCIRNRVYIPTLDLIIEPELAAAAQAVSQLK